MWRRDQLVEEVKRLNEITINSKENYFKLYQELLRKDKELQVKNELIEDIQIKFQSFNDLEKEVRRLNLVEENFKHLKIAYEKDTNANMETIEKLKTQNEELEVRETALNLCVA